MEKKVKITLSGGFHTVNPINAVITASDLDELKRGNMGLVDVLTDHQLRRFWRHFCGVKGCLCGGAARAKWEVFRH